jgi:starch synthase (maltosyl-transferring)
MPTPKPKASSAAKSAATETSASSARARKAASKVDSRAASGMIATLPPIACAGNRRVVIDRITPCIDGGAFPAKRIVGETVHVQANVFGDGHDEVLAVLLFRKRGKESWRELPMRPLGNDAWEAEFTVEEIGDYDYTVLGWVDHFLSWAHGLRKKVESGQDVTVDLMIGEHLLKEAGQRAKGADAKTLQGAAESLGDQGRPVRERAELGLNPGLETLARRYPDRSLATTQAPPLRVQVERERAAFSAWYEFFPRSWGESAGQHGTFRSCERLFPEIARMGFDVVYLPPIHPIGRAHRKGRNNSLQAQPEDPGSPWAIGSEEGGHKAIHPELGTLDDLKHFIAEAERHGLEVAIDIAFQASPDHPYVRQHPEWFKWRPDGTVQYAENPPKKYQDVLPFHFEHEHWPSLWHELKSIFQYWIGIGIKIFRVDNPHTKPLEFWRWLIDDLRCGHPEVILLSEAFTRPCLKYRLAKSGFSQGYTYFTWRNTKDELTQYLLELTQSEVREYFRPNFWPNTPDILPQALQFGGRPAFIARLVLAATLSSNYGIYGPAYELCIGGALEGKEEYLDSEKYEIKSWDWDAHGNLKEIIARLNKIRRQSPALRRTNNLRFITTDNPAIIAYLKATPDLSDLVLTVVNLDFHHTQSGWITLPLDDLGMYWDRPFLVHDLLATGKYLWHGARNFVKLEPHVVPAHVFRLHRHQRHEQDFDYFA